MGVVETAHRLRSLDDSVESNHLEVDDDGKDEDGGQQVHEVGQVLAVEGLAQGAHLVLARGQQVEQGDDGALELGAAARVDRRRTERLPHDRLANVGGDEERNARAEAVALLQQLVQQQHDQAGDEQLDHDQQAHSAADLRRVAVHARHHVHDGLADRDHHAEHCNPTKKKRQPSISLSNFLGCGAQRDHKNLPRCILIGSSGNLGVIFQ